MQSNQLGLLVLDALSSPLVVLDQSGVIVYVNRAWKRFADTNSLAMNNYGIGCNYLDYCNHADSASLFSTTPVDQGIRNVLSGVQDDYLCQYTCHSPTEERWFQMRVTPFDYHGSRHAVALHENITYIKLSETRLWDTFENAPIGMAVVSLDGRIIEANQSLLKSLGYDNHELLNLTCKQIEHPDDFDNDAELLQVLLEGKQASYRIEKRFLKKDGCIVWINQTCSVTRNSSGMPLMIIKQIEDITEKVRAENSLRKSEHRLNVVLDNLPALIGYWNKDLINEFGNKAYTDWFGIDAAHLKGMHLLDVIGRQLFEQNRPYIEGVLSGAPQIFETIIRDVSGMEHHASASYIPDFSKNSVKGFFVMVTDISQTKLAESELMKSQQFSQLLLSLSTDGFTFTDLNGHFIYTNPVFCQMLGYTPEEMLQMSVSEIEQLEETTQIQTRIKKILADGFDRFETVHKHKDGKLIDVEVSSAYLSDKKQLFAFTRDITQRKQSEKLRIQQLELQRDTLVREVHHRIKNHLQGMHGLLSLYPSKTQNEKELIQDISAKISSIAVVYGMQSKTRPGTAYLCEIALEICKSVAVFGIEPPNIEWSINSRHKALLHPEYAVPIALIINELIINAIKHGNRINLKEVFVELTFPDNRAVLIVSNNSQFQADFPNFESGKGLGVGLSLVRAMLPKQGAHLTLKQRQGFVYAEIALAYPVITSLSS